MLGYSDTDMDLAPDWRGLVHPEDMSRVQAAIRDHHPQARPTTIEAILLHDADLAAQRGERHVADVDTVDRIVGKLEANEGRASILLMEIVQSAPFQKRRDPELAAARKK